MLRISNLKTYTKALTGKYKSGAKKYTSFCLPLIKVEHSFLSKLTMIYIINFMDLAADVAAPLWLIQNSDLFNVANKLNQEYNSSCGLSIQRPLYKRVN